MILCGMSELAHFRSVLGQRRVGSMCSEDLIMIVSVLTGGYRRGPKGYANRVKGPNPRVGVDSVKFTCKTLLYMCVHQSNTLHMGLN